MNSPILFSEVAAKLADNGYAVIPIKRGGKHPGFDGWQHFAYVAGCETQYKNYGAGILCATTPGVDIDVHDEELVARLVEMVREVAGIADSAEIPRRVGNWPKVLLPFRTEKPFKKKQTKLYSLKSAPAKAVKLEILADGQQFVGYHQHPDTRKPYSWNGHDLLNTPRAALPLLTEAMADRIIGEAEVLLAEYGKEAGAAPAEKKNHAGGGGPIPEGGRNQHLASLAGTMRRRGMTQDSIEAALLAENSAVCKPPLPADEVRTVAAHVSKYTPADAGMKVTAENFYSYLPSHNYIFLPTREMWPASSVNACIPPFDAGKKDKNGNEIFMPASTWLDRNRSVEQMTWSPGDGMLVVGRLMTGGGWIEHPGCSTFNLYLPPTVLDGDAKKAGRWVDLVHRLFPGEADHIIKWFAHRVQKPGEKINHALVLGGKPGIGKDTVLEPVKSAVGPWNFAEVSPTHMLGRFNGFVKSVILRISEARDLGDYDRFAYYEHIKSYTAAPPDVILCDEKNLREYRVLNVCGVIMTTNHKSDGIYLPVDDRRHFVSWSDLESTDFTPDYWTGIYNWFELEGRAHVAAYLAQLDLTAFDPKAPPNKTPAFWDIVDSNRSPQDAELADVIDGLLNPSVLTLTRLADHASRDFAEWLRDHKNRRQIPHRLETAGYQPIRNPDAKDGLWKIGGKRQVIYAKKDLSYRDSIAAAASLAQ